VEQYSTWYDGARPRYASTNNLLQSINTQIKAGGTFPVRLPAEFFKCMFKIATDWSKNRVSFSPNFKPFVASPTLGVQLLAEAYNSPRLPGKSIRTRIDRNNQTQYFIPLWKHRRLSADDINSFFTTRENFDSYKQWKERLHVAVLNLGYNLQALAGDDRNSTPATTLMESFQSKDCSRSLTLLKPSQLERKGNSGDQGKFHKQ